MKTIKYFIVATSLAASLGLVVNVYAGPGQSRLANAAQVVFTQFAEGIRLSNKDLWRAIYTDNIEGVTQALLDGAHINQLNQYGDTVLVLACSKGDTGIVELLLNNGADINQQDGHGDTPLLWACYKGHSAIVELLLNRSAHINQPNLYGSTPLKEACSKGHAGIVKRLAFHGATLSGQESETMKPAMEQAREARRLVDDCCLTPRDVQIFAPHCTPLAELGEAIRGYTDPLGGVQDPELRELMQKQIIKNRQERFAQERAAAVQQGAVIGQE